LIKKIIIISIWVILLGGLGVLIGFTERQHKAVVCETLSIFIKYNSDDYFITEEDVLEHLSENGFRIKGAPLSTISAGDIESSLYTIPYIAKADVYVTIEGEVKISLTQKRPIAKVFNKNNQCYYIDDEGTLLPQSDKYTARLLVANGEISDYYAPSVKLKQEDSLHPDTAVTNTALFKVFTMAQFIDKDPFWKAMIEEIYVNDENELELFAKIGDVIVIFGDIDNMSEKFSKLFVFYKEGLNKFGWGKYKKINLKYKNQVVCSKT
jgi:cell division protein FtsQ